VDNFVICIRVKETLNEDWSEWFNGLLITPDEAGNTILKGMLSDQAALRGILVKLWDLNLTILSFSCANCNRKDNPWKQNSTN
jgi:hypothetical protein